jgi:hypothetical protein
MYGGHRYSFLASAVALMAAAAVFIGPGEGLSAQATTAPGYWLVASDGGVFAYGGAGFHGSTGGMALNQPVVGMAPTPSGHGYWLVASDGGVFAYGDAGFFGSAGGIRLNRPVVGMAASPTGRGYWLVASDGGVFSYGDARFFGSTGSLRLNRPVVGMAASPTGRGYWLVASDGGIFAYGDARFFGSTGSLPLNRPVVGMAASPTGRGYWLVASDGGIFAYGDARFSGSAGGRPLNRPVVGMAARPSASASGDAVLLAAGDIASCDSTGDEATAAVLDRAAGTVVTLGDNAYSAGTAEQFAECYDPSWGRHKSRTRPAIGNHDYATSEGGPYYDYFGAAAGRRGEGWYSFDLGAWHVVVLNSMDCRDADGCAPGSPQLQWLSADLAAHAVPCTAVVWHHAIYSSRPASRQEFRPLWDTAAAGGADVVLVGHEHFYERFAPLASSGRVDPTGMRQFVVGTGGASHYEFGTPREGSEVRHTGTFGVLRLTLRAANYGWEFLPVAGGTFTDSGTADCR